MSSRKPAMPSSAIWIESAAVMAAMVRLVPVSVPYHNNCRHGAAIATMSAIALNNNSMIDKSVPVPIPQELLITWTNQGKAGRVRHEEQICLNRYEDAVTVSRCHCLQTGAIVTWASAIGRRSTIIDHRSNSVLDGWPYNDHRTSTDHRSSIMWASYS